MKLLLFQSIEEIPPASWQALVPVDFPFWDYAFLRALEKSGSIAGASGWKPCYLSLWENDVLVAALLIFEKNHSYGEYIFDWAWADAYSRYGLPYYPKLISSVPFTPATGPKLLCLPHAGQDALKERLIGEALALMDKKNDSGLHFLFIPEAEIPLYQRQGLSLRYSYQYHWQNRSYQGFDDFLAALKRKRRQQISSERHKVKKLPLTIHAFSGSEIQPEHRAAMGRFYLDTCEKKGAIPYVQPDFFLKMEPALQARCLLILAREHGEWIAGAIFFHQGQKLYGRYWGATREHPFLHFELCYYQPIEWAIAHGIQTFEAGAQGEHKILRGFLPTLTYSAHRIREARFRAAIDDFIGQEKREIETYFQGLEHLNPYRSSDGAPLEEFPLA